MPLLCTDTLASAKVQLAAREFVTETASMLTPSRLLSNLIATKVLEREAGKKAVVSWSSLLDRCVQYARTEGQPRPTWAMERQWRQSESHSYVKQYDESCDEDGMNEYDTWITVLVRLRGACQKVHSWGCSAAQILVGRA